MLFFFLQEATHGQQFVNDLYKNFKREIGFDAIMRLRCSTGLRPVEFFGSFVMNNTTDVELGSIDSDKVSFLSFSIFFFLIFESWFVIF